MPSRRNDPTHPDSPGHAEYKQHLANYEWRKKGGKATRSGNAPHVTNQSTEMEYLKKKGYK